MKVQTTAIIEKIAIDGKSPSDSPFTIIELEFSAVDTGGGFKDPILDFSFTFPRDHLEEMGIEKKHEISLILTDPQDNKNETAFSYKGKLQVSGKHSLEATGRLYGDKLSSELIGFVMKRFR